MILQLVLQADLISGFEMLAKKKVLPIQYLLLNEPRHLFPFYWQKLFEFLENNGTASNFKFQNLLIEGNHDLAIFQKALKGERGKINAQQDGSLLLIKAKRETDAAAFLAKKIQLNGEHTVLFA